MGNGEITEVVGRARLLLRTILSETGWDVAFRRNIELRLAYTGQLFYGWQIQPDLPTVQGELHRCLSRVLEGGAYKTIGASRTDTGVHAHDQHVSVWTDNPIPDYLLQRALNHLLPQGIRVLHAVDRDPSHSARVHAKGKHYAYFMNNQVGVSPFAQPYVWTDRRALDHEAMERAARHLVGTRCFRALQSRKDEREHSTTTIFDARVLRDEQLVTFEVLGHHFLYHMVRNMVGSLVKVGRGEWTPDQFAELLDQGDRTKMGMTAPASGLHLFKIFYGGPPDAFASESAAFRAFLTAAPGVG